MNWYHRGEERYVEYGSSFPATRAFGVVRSLYDTVYNMNMAHLSRAHRTVFEHLDDAGLRTACTTYLIYRGRTATSRRAPASTARIAQGGAVPPRRLGRRASSSTPTCSRRARPAAPRRSACPASATSTPAAWAPTWSSTTCSTSCCSRCPTTTPTRTSAGPTRRSRSIAEADRAIERMMHVAGGADAFLEDHAVIVMSDHSQTAVEDGVNLADALRRRARARARPGAERGGDRRVPVRALGDGLRARRERRDELVRGRGRDAARRRGRRPGRAPARAARRSSAAGAASCASRPAATCATCAARAGASRASRALALDASDGACERRLPGRARAAVVGARVPARRRRAGLGGARLRVRRLGRRRPRGRRQPRLAPPRRLARACCCSAAPTRPSDEPVDAHATSPGWCSSTSVYR